MIQVLQPDGYIKGDTHLIIGSEKTALIDTGMEYCAEQLVEDLKEALNGRPLDYILLSHSHYDHVCGIPALRRAWPNVIVAAHPHAAKILAKDKAIAFMRGMSAQNYEERDPEHSVVGYPTSDYHVDLELTEGMKIDLGDVCFTVLETPGHTKCSISFYDEKEKFLYTSESTGVTCLSDPYSVEPCYLTSFVNSLATIQRLQKLEVKEMIQSHCTVGSQIDVETYFIRAESYAKLTCKLILSMYKNGLSQEQILNIYSDTFASRVAGQPIYAFRVNAENAIKTVIREYEEGLITEEMLSSVGC